VFDGIDCYDPIHDTTAPASVSGTILTVDGGSSTAVWGGVVSGKYQFGRPAIVAIKLVAESGYTFKHHERLYDTYFSDTDTKKKITDYFAAGIYSPTAPEGTTVKIINGPYLSGNDMEFTLQYTVKENELLSDVATYLNGVNIGSFGLAYEVAATHPISLSFPTVGNNPLISVKTIEWESDDDDPDTKDYGLGVDGKQPGPLDKFQPDTEYVAHITLVPDEGYTFASLNANEFVAFHMDPAQASGWGNAGDTHNFKVMNGNFVTMTANVNTDGNLKITLQYKTP
jgi:hypothetical protein